MKKVVQASSSFLWKEPKTNPVLKTINHYPVTHLHTFLTEAETMRLYQDNLVDSEILYGTVVEVVSESNGWARVIVLDQASNKHPLGYPGYVPSETLTDVSLAEYETKQQIGITAKEGVLSLDDRQEKRILSFGTTLPLVTEEATQYRVRTPDGLGRIDKCFAALIEKTADVPQRMIALAEQFINHPYVWAGISGNGFDCSGLMYSLHRLQGILIPRDTIEQAEQARVVSYEAAQPGDLLLFAYQAGKGEVHHVGMYVGNDQMIHSQTPGSRVMKTTISGSPYEPELAVVARYWS
ncbi:NlpC/P60 family protein [Enterococcus sp. DIV0876]|uniref:C40 family peptidase n=1 Tax=Enterococcus sp. DIV0876 TaxID=2774633 RepID=UPI003D2FD949